MELINHTPYSSLIFRTALPKDRLAAAVMVRVTYDLRDGEAIPSTQQLLPLSEKIRQTEFGPIESDLVYRKGGVDIHVFGHAIAPHLQPVKRMEVRVKVGHQLNYRVMVIGDRYWEKNGVGLKISEPERFTKMPLSVYNSYGGNAKWDGLDIPFPGNPYGKGFCWEKEAIDGTPLPNLENPTQPVQRWNDRPDPVGLAQCPMSGLRMKGNVEHEGTKITKISPRIFNAAFPGMIADVVSPGDKVEIKGVKPSGVFAFKVPHHGLLTRISLGAITEERPLKIDQIGIFPALNKVFISYRYPFRYVFKELQKRECLILE